MYEYLTFLGTATALKASLQIRLSIENKTYPLHWDRAMKTDHYIVHNHADIVL